MSSVVSPYQAKILIIDDEPINLAVLEELLESEGYTDIHCEHDPVAAIRIYQDKPFDLILLDLNMPVKSGFDVMHDFKQIDLTLAPPVLVLTALGDKVTKIKALTGGASDFLTKPFDHEEVLSRVKNLISLRLAQKQLQSHNENLEKVVELRTRELNDANIDAIFRLGLVADFRDTETSEHTKRVGRVSKLLAQAIGQEQQYCDKLFYAAPLHDIGKVGVPDSILLKPGKLDPQEWEVMKQHAEMGASILENSPSDILRMAGEIALNHHEKWDGTGYPTGLKGDEIPLSGRIVIIADVFDALSSDRPYKKAWPLNEIKSFMQEQRGIMFDPEIIDKFFEHIDEFIMAQQTHTA